MSRNITAAQKPGRDLYKSDALAQTNQRKYDCFFFASHRKHKKIFSQHLKVEQKIPGTLFSDFILLINIAVEKF